jgi:hypothetical protein
LGSFVSELTFFALNIFSIVDLILPIQVGLLFGKDHSTMDASIGISLLKLAFRTNYCRLAPKIKAEISGIIFPHQLR